MKPRPSFPARLDVAGMPRHTQAGPAQTAGTKAQTAGVKALPTEVRVTRPALGHGMDSQAVRLSMVKKLEAQGITDPAVLQAMATVERHRFVDSALVNQAYEDTSLPIGLGQTISKPGVVSRMIELLRQGALLQNPSGKMGRVLEIGTGCGYQAAVLALLASEVYSIERLRGLHDKARDNLRHLSMRHVHLLFGDGMAGYAKGAPYSGIIAAAGGEAVPQAWIDQLAVGGRLVAPVALADGQARACNGQAWLSNGKTGSASGITASGLTSGNSGGIVSQALMVIDKTAQGCQQMILEPVHFVPLKSGVG